MFNLYEISEEIGQVNHLLDSFDNQLLRICKLRIQLCQRTPDGRLVRVSNPVDTRLIEESKFRSIARRLLNHISYP